MRTTVSLGDEKFIIEEGVIAQGDTFVIRNVKDMLLSVRPESLDHFMEDLRHVFELHYHMSELGVPTLEEFKWVDDGETFMETNFTVVGTDEEKKELKAQLSGYKSYEMI